MRSLLVLPPLMMLLMPFAALSADATAKWEPSREEPQMQEDANAHIVHEGQEEVQEPESADSVPDTMTPEQPVQPAQAASPTPTNAPAGTPTVPPAGPAPEASKAKPPSEGGSTDFNTVLLQGLNKVTAHTQTLEVPIGTVIRYGTIDIVAHKCWKSAPDDRPENAALLEVSETKQGEAPQRIFAGWMFASNSSISGLEHPFYDIHVTGCSKSTAKH